MNENELTTTSEQDIEKIRERAFRQREAFRRMHGGTSETIPREPKRAHDYIYQPGYSERVSVNVPEHREAGSSLAIIALILGVILGSIAALNRNKWPDHVIIFFVTLFTAMPSFVRASFLLMIFCNMLKLVPVWSPEHPSYVLPVIALSLSPMAYITRLTKTSMLDVLGQDYVRTARAKGVHPWKVIFIHSLRNALIPVITYVGPLTASILTGSLVIEKIFTIGGLGAKFVDSITNRDYTLIMGTTIFLATLMVVMNLLSDIVYKLVDPRIKLE